MSAPADVYEPETPAKSPPLARHAVIHSDQLCPCGYNLFGQTVTRDERLGFEVVRCPECGRFSPAGIGTPSSRPWLRQMASLMLVQWSLLVAAGFGAAVLASWGLTVAGNDAFLARRPVEVGTDRPLIEKYDQQGVYIYTDARTGRPVPGPMAEDVMVPYGSEVERLASSEFSWDNRPPPWLRPLLLTIQAAVAFALGVFVSAALWHIGRRRWLMLVVLILPAALAMLPLSLDGDRYRLVENWYTTRIVLATALSLSAMALGLYLGRRVARGLATLLIPPRPRQALAFLWHADGLTLPISS